MSAKLAADVKKQIEYYFSDSNYRRDKFLKAAADADSDALGFVPISTLLTFNKLKSLTTDVAIIVDAIRSSETVAVSDCETKLRRAKALPEDDDSKDRTLYAKGYPEDDPDVTIEKIAEQFEAYGKVLSVRTRKDSATKKFKGSAFVEMDTKESMDAAVAAANEGGAVTISFKDTKLLCVMPLVAWLERKELKRSGKGGKKKSDDAVTGGKRSLEQSHDTSSAPKKAKRDGEEAVSDEKEKTAEEKPFEDKKPVYTPGLILKLTNVPETATMFELKDLFKTLGEVRYCEYTVGETVAYIRLGNIEAAASVKAALEKGLPLVAGGDPLAGSILEGEEESTYWSKIDAAGKDRNGGGGGRGKGGRGGRGGGRGRGRKGGRGNKKW